MFQNGKGRLLDIWLNIMKEEENKIVFVFTGTGPQWWGMGHQLYHQEHIFRKKAQDVNRYFKELSGFSILEKMLVDEQKSEMDSTDISQPANFLLQVLLSAG
jgi:acyl transferase domain-containing protein